MLRSRLSLICCAAVILTGSPAAASDNCLTGTCHSAVLATKHPHSPVQSDDCLSCHKQDSPRHPQQGEKGFSLVAKGEKLCASCHETPGKGPVVHMPVKSGDCQACHQPHGADGKNLLKNSENLTGLCTTCHDKAPYSRKFAHGPVAVGACSTCHNSHRSSDKKLLSRPLNEGCLACHAELSAAIKSSAFVHPPVQVSTCTSCHDPHSSDNRVLLKNKMPDLCFECHKTLQSRLDKVTKLHKPLTMPGSCGKCHASHVSKAKRLLPTDEKTLCLMCHAVDNLGTPPLKNIAKELEGKKFVHGPIRTGKCSACHNPHGSTNFRLLNGPYPDSLYVPYKEGTYDFCLKCHNKNLLRFSESSIYTNFRNGKRNLHFLHVADDRKGRTCRICHEPHASNNEKLIHSEGLRFGEWNVPLNFKITATGGSCAPGCHRPLRYDREKPVVYGDYSGTAGAGTR